MYLTHFGFIRRPFPSTPDSSCYYPATGHEQTLARLLYALEDGEAMVLLTGEAGTGKTLVCHCLLERLRGETSIAFLTNSHIGTRKDLLQATLFDLSLPYENGSEQELRLRLTDYVLTNFAAGRKTLLLVDEAHYLSVEALEELRLLCNLEANQGKAIQVVLVAQPSIQKQIHRPELASIRQRLAVRARLNNLGLDEAIDYLVHHLRAAGGQPEGIFTEEALDILARGTRGIPRLLNQAAHQSLALAFEIQAEEIDAEIALEVLSGMGLEQMEEVEELLSRNLVMGSVAASTGAGSGKHQDSASDKISAEKDTQANVKDSNLSGEDVLSYRLFDSPRQRA